MCRPHALATESSPPQDDKPKFSGCPFTIRQLNLETYLIRENDKFQENAQVYARICPLPTKYSSLTASRASSVIVITDSGVGTSLPNLNPTSSEPPTWNICSFLEHTINPGHRMPYLVMISHCHYDHILGLQHFLDKFPVTNQRSHNQQIPPLTILSSAYDPSFLQPWTTLEVNSLCIYDQLAAPKYNIDIWAGDHEHIHFPLPNDTKVPLPITTFHTPGHTPDSLTWYDHHHRTLFVGDHAYYRESRDSVNAPWGRELVSDIIFCLQSDVTDWFASVDKLLAFIKQQNDDRRISGRKTSPRVMLSAGHGSVDVDAEKCLSAARTFVVRVLKGEVPQFPKTDFQGKPRALWMETGANDPSLPPDLEAISVLSAVPVIEDARRKLLPLLQESEVEAGRPKSRVRDDSIRETSKLRMEILLRTRS